MIKNKNIQIALLLFGLINSAVVSSNPLTELGCGVFAVIANTMHSTNILAVDNLRHKMWLYDVLIDGLCKEYDRKIQTCPDDNQKQIYAARARYIIPASPMKYKMIRGQYRLADVLKQAATIDKNTVKEYATYAYIPNISAKLNEEQVIQVCFSSDSHKTFDWSQVNPVHTTNFAEQAKNNPLIAQDQELSRQVFDNIFSGKGLSHDDSFVKLKTARQGVLSQKKFEIAKKVAASQATFGEWKKLSEYEKIARCHKATAEYENRKNAPAATFIQAKWRGHKVRKNAIT